jgi:hypothetical protein
MTPSTPTWMMLWCCWMLQGTRHCLGDHPQPLAATQQRWGCVGGETVCRAKQVLFDGIGACGVRLSVSTEGRGLFSWAR